MSRPDRDDLRDLIAMNRRLRDLSEALARTGEVAKEAGYSGLAMAALMASESLLAYCKAVNRHCKRMAEKDALDG